AADAGAAARHQRHGTRKGLLRLGPGVDCHSAPPLATRASTVAAGRRTSPSKRTMAAPIAPAKVPRMCGRSLRRRPPGPGGEDVKKFLMMTTMLAMVAGPAWAQSGDGQVKIGILNDQSS